MKRLILCLLCVTRSISADPIQLHPLNPHYFLSNNKQTVLITSGEHYGAVLNLDFDYKTYLRTLNEDGLNLTRLFTGSYVEMPGAFGIEHNTLAPAEWRYITPWPEVKHEDDKLRFDLDGWNAAYFKRLKHFLQYADKQGVIVELTFFSSIYTETNWTRNPFHPDNNVNDLNVTDWKSLHTLQNKKAVKIQEKMVRKIVRELNEFDNLYYEIQNEPWSDQSDSVGIVLNNLSPNEFRNRGGFWENKVEVATEASLVWQKHMAAVIVDEESKLPKKHLIAQNYSNFRFPIAEMESNISILNFHYALPEAVTWNWSWNRPIGYDESGFAGSTADDYRRQVWRFFLSGGAVFNGLDYTFYPGHEDGAGMNNAPGVSDPAFREQLGILRKTLLNMDLVSMQQDHTTILHAPGVSVLMLSRLGVTYFAYLEGNGPNDFIVKLPNGLFHLKWVDPVSGAIVHEESFKYPGGKRNLSTPEFKGELVLELRRLQKMKQGTEIGIRKQGGE